MDEMRLIDMMTASADGELTPTEESELQAYLARSPEQQTAYQALQRADQFLRSAAGVMVEPEPGFTTRFERRLAYHQPRPVWQTWLGLSILLVGTVTIFSLVAVVGGITLLSTWASLLDMQPTSYGLNLLGEFINQIRTLLTLLGLVVRVISITLSQPVVWLAVPLAGGLGWLWLRLLKAPPGRMLTTARMFV